LFACFDNLLAF